MLGYAQIPAEQMDGLVRALAALPALRGGGMATPSPS
jgi:hypothetical protein